MSEKQYRLMDENEKIYLSPEPGQLGGYRRGKIYGRLDCKSANRAIAKGGYVKHRVFFKDEELTYIFFASNPNLLICVNISSRYPKLSNRII